MSPRYIRSTRPLAPVLREPRAAATQETQLLFGHCAEILSIDGKWLRIRGADAYEGFVHEGVYLRFGGGCHGCGMADVTLKQGIEQTLMTRVPGVTAVRDATDHATGAAPYIPRDAA